MNEFEIKAILKIIECGSIKKAAEAENYTPASFLHTVNEVESELGIKIFDRSFRGVKLTESGKAIAACFETLNADYSALKQTVEKLSGQKSEVKIGAYASISKYVLPALVKKFKESCKDADVSIVVGERYFGDLKTGGIDLFFCDELFAKKSNFDFVPLFTEDFVAVVPRSYGIKKTVIDKESLYDYPIIMPNEEAFENYFTKPFKSEIPINADDDETILFMVKQNLGISVLSELSVKNNSKDYKVLRIEPPLSRVVGIACNKKNLRGTTAYKFVKFVEKFYSF